MDDILENTIIKYLAASVLLAAAAFVVKKYFFKTEVPEEEPQPTERLEPMKRRDFTLQQLKEYDGKSNPRILIAVNAKVFDVTRGSNFYGPGEN